MESSSIFQLKEVILCDGKFLCFRIKELTILWLGWLVSASVFKSKKLPIACSKFLYFEIKEVTIPLGKFLYFRI